MNPEPILLDTSVWIFALRKEPRPFLKEKVDSLLKEDLIVITPLIQLELLGGVSTAKEFERLKRRLEALFNIEITKTHWAKAAHLAFQLRRKGLTVPYTDIILSAVAIVEKIVLGHADAHFDLIAKHTPLKVKSFTSIIEKQETSRGLGS